MLAGTTGSGKTVALRDIIDNASHISNPPPEEIIYCYGAEQEIFKTMPNVRFVEGMIDITQEIPRDQKPRWLIIDDLMEEEGKKKSTSELFTKHSHHMNLSVFFVVQNLFLPGIRTISLNTHYLMLFKNPRAVSSVQYLSNQLFPGTGGFLMEAYKDATREPYSYLLIDMKQETPDEMRVRRGDFFKPLPMIAYAPK